MAFCRMVSRCSAEEAAALVPFITLNVETIISVADLVFCSNADIMAVDARPSARSRLGRLCQAAPCLRLVAMCVGTIKCRCQRRRRTKTAPICTRRSCSFRLRFARVCASYLPYLIACAQQAPLYTSEVGRQSVDAFCAHVIAQLESAARIIHHALATCEPRAVALPLILQFEALQLRESAPGEASSADQAPN